MRLSLHAKLLLSYTIILIVIIVGSIYGYLTWSLREDLYARTRQALMTDARLVQAYIETNAPDTLSYTLVDPITDRMGEQCGARVTVITLDGAVLGDSSIPLPDLPGIENHADRPEIIDALNTTMGESIRYSETLGLDMAYAAVPFALAGVTAGVVRLALPVQGFEWIEDQIQRIVVFAALIGLALAVVISYTTSRLVSRPIEQMTGVARRLAAGDFSGTAMAPSYTELHKLADALNEMAAQLRARLMQITRENAQREAVLSGMAEGVMVTDTRGRIVLTNPAFSRMMGCNERCLDKRPIEIIRSAELQEAVDTVFDTDEADDKVSALEITLASGGKTFHVQLTPIRIDQEYHGVVAVFHDITELRRLEQVRRDFVANVSHELRTPLTSIKGYTETLLDGALDEPPAAHRFVGSIQKHADRLQALVEDLLQLSRLESGRSELRLRPCDMGALAQRVVESLDDRVRRRQLTVLFDIQPTRPGRVDEALMEQVLFNLIDNAVKYTPENGTINIRVYEQDSGVCLDVADTGVGIPTDALSRIFERFYRVDRARSREMGGTGLGLSIVRHIMGIHGGSVKVESEVGKGSTFTVTLPVWEGG